MKTDKKTRRWQDVLISDLDISNRLKNEFIGMLESHTVGQVISVLRSHSGEENVNLTDVQFLEKHGWWMLLKFRRVGKKGVREFSDAVISLMKPVEAQNIPRWLDAGWAGCQQDMKLTGSLLGAIGAVYNEVSRNYSLRVSRNTVLNISREHGVTSVSAESYARGCKAKPINQAKTEDHHPIMVKTIRDIVDVVRRQAILDGMAQAGVNMAKAKATIGKVTTTLASLHRSINELA